MRRAAAALAALGAVLALASCGGSGSSPTPPPPQGPPSARHPAAQIAAAQAAEEMRAHLIAATRLYDNARYAGSARHMAVVQREYATLSPAVSRAEPALDREFKAAFEVIAGQIAHHLPAPGVTNRMGLMQGQLIDAAITDAVTPATHNDPGVTAYVIGRLARQGTSEYTVAAAEGFTDRGRRNYQDAFGVLARALTLSHRISKFLGPQSSAIISALKDAHGNGFSTGILMPRHRPAQRVSTDVQRALAKLSKRFGFAV